MPNTNPPADTAEIVEYIRERARQEAVVRVLPIACITNGRKGLVLASLRELAAAGAVAFSDDGDPVKSADIMRQALLISRQIGLPVIDHCEDPVGGPAAGEVRMVARDIKLAMETRGWIHIAHISTAGAVGLVRRAREAGIPVTCEVTPHHIALTEEEIILHGPNAKVNPPLRTTKDIHALVLGLHDDVIDAIATDHAPHTMDEKEAGMAGAPSGISGFETALGSLMALVHQGKIPMNQLISKLTAEPAGMLGARGGWLGTLAVGAPADVTIIDPAREWTVDTAAFVSRGRNTPLAGAALKGKVVATLVGGAMVYRDNTPPGESRTGAPRSSAGPDEHGNGG
jgi:dihydroorotase